MQPVGVTRVQNDMYVSCAMKRGAVSGKRDWSRLALSLDCPVVMSYLIHMPPITVAPMALMSQLTIITYDRKYRDHSEIAQKVLAAPFCIPQACAMLLL
jgi:hypothetical protein